MAAGTYVHQPTHQVNNADAINTYRTFAQKYRFNVPVYLCSVFIKSYTNSGSVSAKAVVYRVSDMARIGEGTYTPKTVTSGSFTEYIITAPGIALEANVDYMIGVHINNSGITYPVAITNNSAYGSPHTHNTSPAGVNITANVIGDYGVNSGDGYPTPGSGASGEALIGLSLNLINQAPTVSNLGPAYGDNRTSPLRVTWTYSDPESNNQTQYEVGYRVNGTTGAFTTITQTSPNRYHDFATGTFTHGVDYEWRVRAYDAFNWSNYATAVLVSGTALWTTPTAVSSATSSGTLPNNLASGNYEVEVRTADAAGFGPWSSLTSFTVSPPNNIWVYKAGVWVPSNAAKKTLVAGTWKDVPPTKKYSGGAWT